MRRPAGVKGVLLSFRWTRFFLSAELPLSPPFHPHSSMSDFVSLGASWVFSFQPVLPPVSRPLFPSLRWKLGQAINAVTGTRRLGFVLPIHESELCRRRQHGRTAIPQRFVHFSADPQAMQQHRQLSCSSNHHSFLPILSAPLGQLQPPAPQIAVYAKRSQDVVRSLYQQGSQIRIALLADVQLRFALPRVAPPR